MFTLTASNKLPPAVPDGLFRLFLEVRRAARPPAPAPTESPSRRRRRAGCQKKAGGSAAAAVVSLANTGRAPLHVRVLAMRMRRRHDAGHFFDVADFPVVRIVNVQGTPPGGSLEFVADGHGGGSFYFIQPTEFCCRRRFTSTEFYASGSFTHPSLNACGCNRTRSRS